MKEYENYRDPVLICPQELLQGCLQPDIRHKARHSSRKRASKLNIPRNTGSSSGVLLNTR
jgi:hypothetical protein